MEIQLLKAAVKETIKETITEIITAARRHQSAWLGRKRDRKGQGYDSSSSITITHTITQTTSQATTPELPPLISYVHPFARRDRAWSPSLLTIDSEIEFSPEGSPPGAALGIPPEHILDEDPSPIDGPIPLNLAKAAAPATIWGADNYMVHKLSSFDGASSIVSFASHLGGIGEGDESPNNGSRRPSSTTLGAFGVRMVAQNEQRETIEDATMSLPEQQSSLSDDVLFFSLPNRAQDLPAAASSFPSAQNLSTSRLYRGKRKTDLDSSPCSLCGMSDTYQKPHPNRNRFLQERRAYLPCGHFFGHRCLYSWIYSAFGNRQPLRCPRGCISLLHKCGHPTMPVWQRPARLHCDPATAIPWNYEFCESKQGKMCIRIVSRYMKAERATAPRSISPEGQEKGKRGLRKRLHDTVIFPVSARMHLAMKQRRQHAMRYWRRRQVSWWLDRWTEALGFDRQGMPF